MVTNVEDFWRFTCTMVLVAPIKDFEVSRVQTMLQHTCTLRQRERCPHRWLLAL